MDTTGIDEDLVHAARGNPKFLQQLHMALPQTESLTCQAAKWSIEPQESSPLFASLPPELRIKVFNYALSEHNTYFSKNGEPLLVISEPEWLLCKLPDDTKKPSEGHSSLSNIDDVFHYVRNGRSRMPCSIGRVERVPVWLRPDQAPRRFQHTELLRTCRRIFVEARDLLMKNTTLRLFFGSGYMFPRLPFDNNYRIARMTDMTRYTANRISSLELHVSQLGLEDSFLGFFFRCEELRCIKNLRIIISHLDWENGPLLTPYESGRAEPQLVQRHMEATKYHGVNGDKRAPIPPIDRLVREANFDRQRHWGAWGEGLSMIPNLSRLTIDFEDTESWFAQLLSLSEWAQRVWTFRLGGRMKGYYLSAQGNPVKKSSWRALDSRSNSECEYCTREMPLEIAHAESYSLGGMSQPEYLHHCLNMPKSLDLELELYPRLMDLRPVTWTARKLEPEDGDDAWVTDKLKDSWPELGRDALMSREALEQMLKDDSYLTTVTPIAFRDVYFLGFKGPECNS
ncbi:hypothetical protein F66182_2151 [Fusarium sp. NRRL 66182]|nr:hypothetical protein F66182_2151 [Fusarium sp. NRRL 66182]